MDLKVLKQITIEDRFSKKEVNNLIYKDLTSNPAVITIFEEMKDAIRKQIVSRHTFWDSKNKRYALLSKYNELIDVATYILVSLLKTEGKVQEVHATVNFIATRLSGYRDFIDAVKTASELLAVTERVGTHRLIRAADAPTGVLSLQSAYVITNSTAQILADHMYLPPMVCQPNEIINNSSSGYINPTFESVILKHYNHHDKEVAVDVLNIANSVEWCLDEEILAFEEKSKKPLDTPQKLNNFLLLKNSSRKVYKMLLEIGNKFFFSWRYDKRGRMYSQGYHVNIQSNDYKKAAISFANKEIIKH